MFFVVLCPGGAPKCYIGSDSGLKRLRRLSHDLKSIEQLSQIFSDSTELVEEFQMDLKSRLKISSDRLEEPRIHITYHWLVHVEG